jgi:hypothetical protein
MRDPVHLLTLIAVLALGATLLWEYAVEFALMAVGVALSLDSLQLVPAGIDIGINVYADDIACLVLLSAGALVTLRKRRVMDTSAWAAFALFALATVNLARGAMEFGLKSAGNGARNLIYLSVPMIALILLRPALRVNPKRVANLLGCFGCALTIVAVLRWTGALRMPQLDVGDVESDFREVVRTLGAGDALVIGQSLLAIIYLQFFHGVRMWRTSLAAILAVVTIALQHRSVWVSTFVGLVWLAASSLRSSQRRWLQLAGATFIGITVTVITLSATGGMDRIISLITANFEETQQQDSTWNWRVKGFAEATERLFSSNTFEMLVGPPSGRDLESSAGFASIHVHNRYIATIAYYGLFGGIVLAVWLFAVGRKVGAWVRVNHGDSPKMCAGTAFLQALLLSQLTYFFAYTGGIEEGSITALIWLAAASQSERDKVCALSRPCKFSASDQLRLPTAHHGLS